jgi:predicted site-specific integrase-resolvase
MTIRNGKLTVDIVLYVLIHFPTLFFKKDLIFLKKIDLISHLLCIKLLNPMSNYVTPKTARQRLGVSDNALKEWDSKGIIKTIRTPGGKRLYDISCFNTDTIQQCQDHSKEERIQICYCRVSTIGQKEDLKRQIEDMQKRFPDAKIISDVASGINFKRKGLRTILELSSKGFVSEVVVAYRDRLCRFSFELIEWFLQLHGVKLMVLNQAMETDESDTTNNELVEDILAIINVFNCRINGQRRYKNRIKQNQQTQEIKQTNCQSLSADQIISQSGDKEKTKIMVRVRQKNLQPCLISNQTTNT